MERKKKGEGGREGWREGEKKKKEKKESNIICIISEEQSDPVRPGEMKWIEKVPMPERDGVASWFHLKLARNARVSTRETSVPSGLQPLAKSNISKELSLRRTRDETHREREDAAHWSCLSFQSTSLTAVTADTDYQIIWSTAYRELFEYIYISTMG